VLRLEKGTARLVEAGTIRSKPKDPLQKRLAELGDGLDSVLASFSPSAMGMEQIFSHYAHPSAAIAMAHARGVFCFLAAKRGVRVTPIPATMVKKLVTGNGRASKEQVAGMVKHLLGVRELPGPADVGDALAIAIAAIEMDRAMSC
jgi:crossover junction endodeoxyribonuclease RuvC